MREPFAEISADEHDRLHALYGPLTTAVRKLVDASIRTGVDDQVIRDAQAAIEAVTATLESRQYEGPRTLRHAVTGRPVAWADPAIGLRNAIAPPLDVQHTEDGRCWTEFTLGAPYEGPPDRVHGGICALVLDHVLGEVASEGLVKPRFTGTLTLKYLRGTPLGPLRAEAWIDRTEGVKAFARGRILDAEGVTVEAEGIFVMPAWAREAG
ncbi:MULTISPECIES: PaaI family thioesterase [Mycobacteriaceae]|jgi:acyl-coenzyme A thioesterase PaaI-like protein|uniref:Thioesterase superfamily protein n=1 Tax=Mycolicibacterium fluoranthenivorans TaxID=258505 RepID=A0A1G4VAU8_9MYCO|nr:MULTISPECIES: PaaI family thioesterase [Mycobacteriaceae]MCV7254578.1 PaaI family thioesterase [Mycobacterium hackensackense]SCX03907.1 Thioesterase superfamily protein [Mycolicibacterium fluoranthenivorans]